MSQHRCRGGKRRVTDAWQIGVRLGFVTSLAARLCSGVRLTGFSENSDYYFFFFFFQWLLLLTKLAIVHVIYKRSISDGYYYANNSVGILCAIFRSQCRVNVINTFAIQDILMWDYLTAAVLTGFIFLPRNIVTCKRRLIKADGYTDLICN